MLPQDESSRPPLDAWQVGTPSGSDYGMLLR
jgi:hypothetical protein